MMLSNQLKQLAKDYNIFIFSSTQTNAKTLEQDFKDENCIRGSRAVADSIKSRLKEKSLLLLGEELLGSLKW